jgi:glycosyltransferase involved in cell wall biosynthesis
MPPLSVVHLTSVHNALDHRIFKKECRSLAKAGFDVTVVGPYPEDAVKEMVRIKAVKKHPSKLGRMTRTVWNVFQEARKLDADIYHFHDPELIPVGLLLRGLGKKVVYDVHEDFPQDMMFKSYLPDWSKRVLGRLMELTESAACKQFSAIVVVTPGILVRLQKANPKTVTIFNYPYPEELIVENAPAWDDRSFAATYVGTITPQRGIAGMVEAIGLLSDSLGATLEIAGDTIPEEVKKFPGWSRVRFHGILDQLSTYKLLRKARVGLICEHPIRTFLDSFPVKIFEYMGAGLPIIASDFPLWRELLSDKGCAIFIDPFDTRGIAQAIEYILTHPIEAEAMGRRGQAAVAQEFNWHTQARKLVNLYSGLATNSCAELLES